MALVCTLAVASPGSAGVMKRAAAFGLGYGAVIAFLRNGSRSMAGCARSDRELTDDEITELKAILECLHDLTERVETLSPAVHMTLKQMSIYLTHG